MFEEYMDPYTCIKCVLIHTVCFIIYVCMHAYADTCVEHPQTRTETGKKKKERGSTHTHSQNFILTS